MRSIAQILARLGTVFKGTDVATGANAPRRIVAPRQFFSGRVKRSKKNQPPRPTSAMLVMHDGREYRWWTDGSIRHAVGRVRGKAARKALKRLGHQRRNAARLASVVTA